MTAEIERRDFIQRAGLLAAVAATATGTVIERPAFAEGAASQTGGKGMTYAPKPLSTRSQINQRHL